VFTCTVSEIRSKQIPEIGQALAERVGEPDLETLSAKVKESVEAQSNDNSMIQTRDALRAQLGAQYDFDVPASLIESSLSERRSRAVNTAVREGTDIADAEKAFDEQEGVLEDVKSSMRAMFVLDDVARGEAIDVTPFDVHQEVEKLAGTMGPYAHQFRQMYQDADRRALLSRRLKHDKVLDFILTKANVTDIPKDVPKHEDSEDTGEDNA